MRRCFHLSSLLILIFLTLLSACGGGSGSSSGDTTPETDFVILSGSVIDPEIVGATVRIVSLESNTTVSICGSAGTTPCMTTTDENGNFSFQLPSNTILTGYEIVSDGGVDKRTGVHFDFFTLKAPLALFATGAELSVTPFTTLVSDLMAEGNTLVAASEQVATLINLSTVSDLARNPMDDEALLTKGILVSLLLEELFNRSDVDPFNTLISQGALFTTLNELDNSTLQSLLDNDSFTVDNFANMQTFLNEQGGYQQNSVVYDELQKMIFKGVIIKTILESEDDTTGIDVDNVTFASNVDVLTESLLSTMEANAVSFNGITSQRAVRYVLYHYDIDSYADLSSTDYTSAFAQLSSDVNLLNILLSSSEIDVRVPLTSTELLDSTSSSMLDYYYKSNISNLYKAEKMIQFIYDDEINDDIMMNIALGNADVGRFTEAISILNSSIYQSAYKADTMRGLADELTQVGRTDEAVYYLDTAFGLYQNIIASKGVLSINDGDTTDLALLIRSFVDAGAFTRADAVLTYYKSILDIETYDNIYSLVNGLDYLIEIVSTELKAGYVDELYAMSQLTPIANGRFPHDANKVNNFLTTVYHYGVLGNVDKVNELKSMIIDTRFAVVPGEHPARNTAYYSDQKMYKLIQALQMIDASAADIEAVITTIGSDYIARSYALLMAGKAVSGDLSLAELNSLSSTYDQIEALTYYAQNYDEVSNQYAAYQLMTDGQIDNAKIVLAQVQTMVNSLEATQDVNDWYIYSWSGHSPVDRLNAKIRYGYLKLANLYYLMNDMVNAEAMLDAAKLVADEMSGLEGLVPALVEIATGNNTSGFVQVGADQKAEAALTAAESLVTAATLDVDDQLDYYEKIIEGYIAAGLTDAADSLTTSAITLAETISDESSLPEDIEDEIDYLLELADLYADAGFSSKATQTLLVVETLIQSLPENMQTEYLFDDGVAVVGGFVKAGDIDNAARVAASIGFNLEKKEAIKYIAAYFAGIDTFAGAWIASVDTDNDGKPDFFHPDASTDDILMSGLVLDDDVDGDGILNEEDVLPYWSN